MIDLSVVIVNHNVQHYLLRTLESLRIAAKTLSHEVFVVDNASTDGSVALIRERFPEVRLIASPQNLGFARANNLALREASGRYLMLLNPDCLLEENSLTALIDHLEHNSAVGAVGPKLLNRDGTFQRTSKRNLPTPWNSFCKLSGLSGLFPSSPIFAGYELGHLDPDSVHEVEALCGAAILVRREVYEAVGGLDEEYFMFGEDLDWCRSILNAGWKIHYLPASRILHYKGESSRRSNVNRHTVFFGAMRVYYRKHGRNGSLRSNAIGAATYFGEYASRLRQWLADSFVNGSSQKPVPVLAGGFVSLLIVTYLLLSARKPLRLLGGLIAAVLVIFAFSRPNGVIFGSRNGRRRVMIIGVDPFSRAAARRIVHGEIPNRTLVGFIQSTPSVHARQVEGFPAFGDLDSYVEIIRNRDVDEILFSIGSVSLTQAFDLFTQYPVRGSTIQFIGDGFDRDGNETLLD